MEIIIYQGPSIDAQVLERMAQDTAASAAAEEVELRVHTCRTREELSQAVRAVAYQELASRERYFPFKTIEGAKLLKLSQVLYFKSCGHRIVAVMADGRELMGRTLRVPTAKLLEPLVESGQFYRIFRSTFVNKMHISVMGPDWVRLDTGGTMSVSRKYYQALLRESIARSKD